MDFVIDNYKNHKFHLTLLSEIENTPYLTGEIEKNDNIVIFNPDFVVSSFQIILSINKALYNLNVLKKSKSEKLKREILYHSSEKGKVDLCIKLHKINNESPNCYFLFIDMSKEDIGNIKTKLKGNEVRTENYSKFVNYEKIIKEFELSEEEMNNDSGIMGAVYNRIAIKDLK